MSQYKLVGCPYDEAHKVKESRLSLHITKCRLNHLDEEKFTCPFNATHVLPRQERDYHLLNCADKAPLDRAMTYKSFERNNPFKGRTDVPSYTESIPTVTDEVWETDYNGPSPGQLPVATPAFAIVEPPPMSKPAERRRLYQELHRMPTELENISNQSSNVPPKETGIQMNRQPKAPSQTENKKIFQEYQNLGLGRGKSALSNRIAANIFPPTPSSKGASSNNVNYSAALVSGMSNLGLGRGFPVSNAEDNPLNDDDQFPALGCGRGVYRSTKNSVRYPGSRS